MDKSKFFLLPACLLFAASLSCTRGDFVLHSPDGNVTIRIRAAEDLSYSLTFHGQDVLVNSPLGFDLCGQKPVGVNLSVTAHKFSSEDREWEPVAAKHRVIRDYYNELVLNLREDDNEGRSIDVVFRAYNDGIGFRYFFPGPEEEKLCIGDERTGFVFPVSHSAWVADYGSFVSHQESEFRKKSLADITDTTITGMPLLIECSDSLYLAISESNLRDWAGMYLEPAETGVEGAIALKVKLSPPQTSVDHNGMLEVTLPHYSPWRVILLGKSPGSLLESELIMNLADPSELSETGWIKPGMCAWDHWWSGDVKMDTETLKKYIRLASDMGWPYQLIDWNWYGPFDRPGSDITTAHPNVDMEEVLHFAAERNVRCWLWLYWTDVDRQMDEAFALYEKWGIAGVKVDFMQRDDQVMVNWYEKVVRKAADHHLMVNFHGAFKNTGLERTLPNMMTREGVLGNEYNGWSDRITPEHNVTIPFTRMLAGPADYTPGGFLNVTQEQFRAGHPTQVMGTRANELAKFVVYFSPITTVCDHPDHYAGQTGLEFLRKVKTVTDNYLVLGGYPGEFILVARQSGNDWFVAALNNSEEREILVDFGFLPEGSYQALVYEDTEISSTDAASVKEHRITLLPGDQKKIRMVAGGGWAAYLEKNN